MIHDPPDGGRRALNYRVLVVSDVLLYREGVAAGLARMGRLSIAGTASGEEAIGSIASVEVDAVLLDASSTEALAIAHALKTLRPEVPIVGFGIGDEANSLAGAEVGLVGFVHRDGTLSMLAEAVEEAIAGRLGCTPELAAMLCRRVAALGCGAPEAPTPLTRRERQIASLVADGLSNKEIAIELHIGPATVKNHIHNILEKLRVRRRGAIGSRFRTAQIGVAPSEWPIASSRGPAQHGRA